MASRYIDITVVVDGVSFGFFLQPSDGGNGPGSFSRYYVNTVEVTAHEFQEIRAMATLAKLAGEKFWINAKPQRP